MAGWWRGLSRPVQVAVLILVAAVALVGLNVWLHRPPSPDENALHAAIQAGRSGTEVTFAGTLVDDPTSSGDHERMLVRDRLGDTLELDYNTSLGRPVPAHRRDSMVIHGQLYVDQGRAGVHCLHAHTSRGCPEPGWIQFAGATYS